MDKPFWKSRKFGYAAGTLLASLLVALLSRAEGVSPDVQAALNQMLPTILVVGVLLITGHTITDVAAIWAEGVAAKDLKDAVIDLIEVLLDGVDDDDNDGDKEPKPEV